MWLWNFAHGQTPFHTYELLGVLLALVMAAVAAVHSVKERRNRDGRDEK